MPGTSSSESSVEKDECGFGYSDQSQPTQWRTQQKVLKAANHDRDAVLATGVKVLKAENTNSAYVLKRVSENPNVGDYLAKCLKKMDKELSMDEDGERITPISCLAYLLGEFSQPCSMPVFQFYRNRTYISDVQLLRGHFWPPSHKNWTSFIYFPKD